MIRMARVVLQTGKSENAVDYLICYSCNRLFRTYVSYAVETCAEGGYRHHFAESAFLLM